jgi:low temperature requirement protein LtrA
MYFRDEDGVEHAMVSADEARRPRLALIAFGYWHYGLLLGVVAIAAGMKKAVGDPYDPLVGWIGIELGVGVALFVVCTVGFRTTLGLGVSRARLVSAVAALATIPLGTEWSAAAQLGALMLIVAAALLVEARADHEMDFLHVDGRTG